jgi:hypothetical protein
MLARVRGERDAAEAAEARLRAVAAEAHTIAEALQQSKIKVCCSRVRSRYVAVE